MASDAEKETDLQTIDPQPALKTNLDLINECDKYALACIL